MQAIIETTPEATRDVIVRWLRYQAKRHQSAGTMDSREGEKSLAIADAIELLAEELAGIPCINSAEAP